MPGLKTHEQIEKPHFMQTSLWSDMSCGSRFSFVREHTYRPEHTHSPVARGVQRLNSTARKMMVGTRFK